jgi:hypothetical protein
MQNRMPLSTPSWIASNPNRRLRCQVMFSIFMGLLLMLSGCRGASSVQVDVLEQELRQQEDYIYELEDYLVEYSEKLRQARLACRQKADKAKSSTKPARSENLLDDDDLIDQQLSDDQPPSDQPESTPKGAAPAPPQAETEEIPDPATSTPAPEPADTEQPSTPSDLDDLEIPELKIEKPSASRSNRQSLPWSITDTKILRSSAAESAIPSGPLRIPDPVNYRPSRPELRYEQPDFYMEQASEDAYELNLLETEIPSTDRLAAEGSVHDAILDKDGTAAIDRIVIQQLLQNSLDEDLHPEEDPSQAGTSPSSPRSTIPPRSLLAVVEIRDLANEPVDAEGELSLMVMAVSPSQANPAGLQQGKPRRLQRWDFSAEEVLEAWQSSPLGDGLHLELPLAEKLLANDSLELWARLVTVDGHKYLTKLPFTLQHLVALRDALSVNPGYDGPENETPLPTGSAAPLADRTMQGQTPRSRESKAPGYPRPASGDLKSIPGVLKSTQEAEPAIRQWHPARIQSLPPGTAVSHRGTKSAEPPHWVAQTGSSRARARRQDTASRRPPAVNPGMAAGQSSAGSTPAWKSTLR